MIDKIKLYSTKALRHKVVRGSKDLFLLVICVLVSSWQGVLTCSAQQKEKPKPLAICADMGGENGWGSWQALTGANNYNTAGTPLFLTPVTVPSAPRFNLTSGIGVDPCTPGPNPGSPAVPVVCPFPGFGNTSIQIGQPQADGIAGGCASPPYPPNPPVVASGNGCVERLTYPLSVSPQDTNFLFAYAVVLEDPQQPYPHTHAQQPYVEFMILDSNGDTLPCAYFYYAGDSPNTNFYTAACGTNPAPLYKPWALQAINLSAYVNQTVTVVITNSDCALGGHFCHAYFDFTCLPAPNPPVSFCPGSAISLCAPFDTAQGFLYQWYQNGVLIPGGTTQCINPIAQPGDTFSVNISQLTGCGFFMKYVPQPLSINAGITSAGSCGTIQFSDNSTSPDPNNPITNWNWSFPGGTPASSSSQNPGNVVYPPGTYTVTLIVTTAMGCSDTTQYTFALNGMPVAAFSPTAPCLGGITLLNDGSVSPQGDPITSWSWQIPGGAPASSASQNTSTIYGAGGTHTVTLIVTTQSGCKDTISQQVLVYTPPVANFSGPIAGCLPVCNNYSDLSTNTDGNIISWQWDFPGGNPSSSAVQNPQNICYNTAGSYSASVIVENSYGCRDTLELPVVNAYPWPAADFCVAPAKAPATDPVFDFCDQWSSDVVQWTWNFGDGDTDLVNTDPQHSYASTAFGNDYYSYNICLNVKNQYGCWDTVCHPVELIPEFTFYIPNCFTPNGNFVNELFFGKSRGVKDYNIWLFDRWGNLIWDCHYEGKNTDWDFAGQDGMSSACKWSGPVVNKGADLNGHSGQLAQEDVYVWKVQLTDIFDKHHFYIGHVSIVR